MCGPAAAQVKALVLVAERRRVLSKQALQVLGEEKNNQPFVGAQCCGHPKAKTMTRITCRLSTRGEEPPLSL